jgi:hypothetical protein
LIVISGTGRVQRSGGPIEDIELILNRVTSCGLHRAMRHIAIAEARNGKVVDWMEHVSDEQYRA